MLSVYYTEYQVRCQCTAHFFGSSRKRRCVRTNDRLFGLGRQVRRSLTSWTSSSWPSPPSTIACSATGLPSVPSGGMEIACRGGNLLPTRCQLLALVVGGGVQSAPVLLLGTVSPGPLPGVSLLSFLSYRYRYRFNVIVIVIVIELTK